MDLPWQLQYRISFVKSAYSKSMAPPTGECQAVSLSVDRSTQRQSSGRIMAYLLVFKYTNC